MPKQYVRYGRWDKGLNSKFDSTDIAREQLADVNQCNISRPGRIATTGNPTTTENEISVGMTPHLSGHGAALVQADYTIGSSGNGALNTTGLHQIYVADSDGDVTGVDDASGTPVVQASLFSYGGDAGEHKPAFLWAEGGLRVSDANHYASGKTMWWGYVDRTRFHSDDAWNTVNNWIAEQAGLRVPVVSVDAAGTVFLDHDADSYPTTGGNAPFLEIEMSTSETDGRWESTDYEFGISYVYMGNQESSIVIMVMRNDTDAIATVSSFSLPTQQYWANLKVFASTTSTSNNFFERVTGCRFYVRKLGKNRRWRLLLDADFTEGVRLNTFDDFTHTWNKDGTGEYYSNIVVAIKSPSIETYESLNGYRNNESATAFAGNQQTWEDAALMNRRAFYIGCFYKDENNNSRLLGDRIFYSQPGRPDTVPSSNWIDLGVNDGQSFTAIEGFNNRIVCFKQNTIFIMNVSNSNVMGWNLEQTIEGNGVKYGGSVVKTRYGIVWANSDGCFIYTGRGMPEELTNNIDSADWALALKATGTTELCLGYDSNSSHLVVSKADASSSGTFPSYIYDFTIKAWSKDDEGLHKGRTNFINAPDGDLLWVEVGDTPGTTVDVYSWKRNAYGSIASPSPFFTMFNDNFGHPARLKKIYNVYVTVTLGGAYDIDLQIITDTGTTTITQTAGTAFTGILTFTPPSPLSTEKAQLKFINNNSTNSVIITDITVEYRPLGKTV